ncbi:MAG TPA: choice-of-anchor J domain-containing protein [Cyclobacteriaceae bacterium]
MSAYLKYFLIILALCFIRCSDKEQVGSMVSFTFDRLEINPNEIDFHINVGIGMEASAPVNSSITIDINSFNSYAAIITTPKVVNDQINLLVEQNSGEVNFLIDQIERVGSEAVIIEFEISSVGDGLIIDDLEGRFFTLVIEELVELPITFPYEEDFTSCQVGEFPPRGWQEVVIEQNNEGSARWGCISGPAIGINAFVEGSNDTTSSVAWMISPGIEIPSNSNPSLSFDVDRRFEPDDESLEQFDILISTEFTGNNLATSSWQRFQPGYEAILSNDPGLDDLTNTGNLSLTAYEQEKISIAFVYRAGAVSSFDATVLRIGNFVID